MGRYTQQQIREVVRQDSQNEYTLICYPEAEQRLILPEIRRAENVSIAFLPFGAEFGQQVENERTLLHTTEIFQQWLSERQIDLYHATTPFLLSHLTFPQIDVCPVVVTLYDLIPYLFADTYLPDESPLTVRYQRAIDFIRRADRVVAISQSARADAIRHLGIAGDRIDIAYPIAEPQFRRLAPAALASRQQELRQRLGLPESYALCVAQWHHSKNIETLLDSYALLPYDFRQYLPLVLVGALTPGVKAWLHDEICRRHIASSVFLAGFVEDDDLVTLYNGATLLIHPSRYEGFGMPILEAMQCGTPVVCSNTASMPEVGGEAAVYVDPDSAQGFADAVAWLASNPAQRHAMAERGLKHAKAFSNLQLGYSTLLSYRRAHTGGQHAQAAPRPRIALWTPLPPEKSGISDYSAELLAELSSSFDIEVFVDDGYLPSADLLGSYTIHHYKAFERRNHQQRFDTIIYQMGASFFHLYMYEALQRWPGIVVLHDLGWGIVLFADALRNNTMPAFKDELLRMEGRLALAEFEQIERTCGYHSPERVAFLDRHHMIQRIAYASTALVVHMGAIADELREHYPGVHIETIEMGVEDPVQPGEGAVVRRRYGLDKHTFTIGVFGIVDRVKHVDTTIRAFQRINLIYPNSHLMIVGQQIDPIYEEELHQLADSLGLHFAVSFVGHATEREFDGLLNACDIVVNLRYPSKKQMSAVLVRAIAAGKPVIITNLPEWDFFPSSFCWKLPAGPDEADQLFAYLQQLANDPTLRTQMGQEARSYFEQSATIPHMAKRYERLIQQILTPLSNQQRPDGADTHAPPLNNEATYAISR